MPGSKHWCFTLNNYGSEDEERIEGLFGRQEIGVKYICYGREVGETGTAHLQGFVSFDKRRTLAFVRRHISDQAHFESAKGSPTQAAAYCKKEGDFYEAGECPGGKGTRTDIASCVEAIKNGASRRDLIENHPGTYGRYHKMCNEAIRIFSEKRTWQTKCVVYWGKTGTGKTRKVYDENGFDKVYKHLGGRWFDGYEGEDIVLFDDFDGSVFQLNYLLQLIDRYPMVVEVKGGTVNFKPRTVYFTSNKDPKTWYSNAFPEHQAALMRRLTEGESHIVHFPGPLQPP